MQSRDGNSNENRDSAPGKGESVDGPGCLLKDSRGAGSRDGAIALKHQSELRQIMFITLTIMGSINAKKLYYLQKKKGHRLSGAPDNSVGYAGANYYPGEGIITAERLHNPSLSPDLNRLHPETNFPLSLSQGFGGISGGTVQRPRTTRAPKRSSGQDPCGGSLVDEFRSPITNSATNPKHSLSTPKQFSTGIYQQRRSVSTTTLLMGTPWEQRFVALHDYTARVEDDLSMTKGQQFCIIDRSQGYWWYAKCISSGLMGYVPYNYLAPVTSLESNE
ncbi:unnamed protein product [Schistocephalus solidus]|uniref:SH3 domain-containing protein n=1 Tax=Schistocephalus solidus TaxID=70667 RepID=A0A183TJW1_SCHSO|nr:unnamed protein product [Schistocephalus solidus]